VTPVKAFPRPPAILAPTKPGMKPHSFKALDVRPLLARGDEPFPAIRAQVDALKPGVGLTVIAPFMPAPLIELLRGEGFHSSLEHRGDGSWAVSFWRD
jgi:uncharacterized protein (DUF2249 family)